MFAVALLFDQFSSLKNKEMSDSTRKRTLDAFFNPPARRVKISEGVSSSSKDESPAVDQVCFDPLHYYSPVNHVYQELVYTYHPTYPFPIPCFPESISSTFSSLPSTVGKVMNDQTDLDLLYFEPYIPKYLEKQIFQFLRKELPFYRVEYTIKRGDIETQVRTPR
jgi:hypothetical protein